MYRINCQQLIFGLDEHVHSDHRQTCLTLLQVICSVVIQAVVYRIEEQDISRVCQNLRAQVQPDPGQVNDFLRTSFVTMHAAIMCDLAGESTPAPKPLASGITVRCMATRTRDTSMEELNLSGRCRTYKCPVGVRVQDQSHVHYGAAWTSSGPVFPEVRQVEIASNLSQP